MTNGAIMKTSEYILTELSKLKTHIESTLTSSIMIISKPIIRNAKASFTIKNLIDELRKLNIKQIYNGSITTDHISKKGLDLNAKGTERLALNIREVSSILSYVHILHF